jgi:hypothetical protein
MKSLHKLPRFVLHVNLQQLSEKTKVTSLKPRLERRLSLSVTECRDLPLANPIIFREKINIGYR